MTAKSEVEMLTTKGSAASVLSGARSPMAAALRKLAAELRGPPRAGENLRASDALEVAAVRIEALHEAADAVVRSYGAGDGRRWPAIEALDEMLSEREAT